MWALALGTSEKIHGTDRQKYGRAAHRRGSVYGVLLDLDKREVSAPPSHKTFTSFIRIHSRNQRLTSTTIATMRCSCGSTRTARRRASPSRCPPGRRISRWGKG